MFDLTTRDIKYLQGVGPQRAVLLNKELEIYSLHDLLYYFPYKYVDRSRLYYIHEIDGNMPYIQLKGQILSFETVGVLISKFAEALTDDETGEVILETVPFAFANELSMKILRKILVPINHLTHALVRM